MADRYLTCIDFQLRDCLAESFPDICNSTAFDRASNYLRQSVNKTICISNEGPAGLMVPRYFSEPDVNICGTSSERLTIDFRSTGHQKQSLRFIMLKHSNGV